jgi:hypothetical protein
MRVQKQDLGHRIAQSYGLESPTEPDQVPGMQGTLRPQRLPGFDWVETRRSKGVYHRGRVDESVRGTAALMSARRVYSGYALS